MNTDDYVMNFRVYLEDTDAQGIVYHANYLRYFERGRSENLESLGIPMKQINNPDSRLVVYETRIKFRRPVFLGDRIEVSTSMRRESDYRLNYRHKIRRQGEEEVLVDGEVDVVAIDRNGALRQLPAIFGSA